MFWNKPKENLSNHLAAIENRLNLIDQAFKEQLSINSHTIDSLKNLKKTIDVLLKLQTGGRDEC